MRSRADDAGPNDPAVGVSKLVDGVLALLEEAGVPTEINDQIVKLIEAWEYSQIPPEPEIELPHDEPPACDPWPHAGGWQ